MVVASAKETHGVGWVAWRGDARVKWVGKEMTLLFTPGCYYYVRRPCSPLVRMWRGKAGRAGGGRGRAVALGI